MLKGPVGRLFFFVEVEEVGGNLPLGVDAFLIVRIVLLFENLLVL